MTYLERDSKLQTAIALFISPTSIGPIHYGSRISLETVLSSLNRDFTATAMQDSFVDQTLCVPRDYPPPVIRLQTVQVCLLRPPEFILFR